MLDWLSAQGYGIAVAPGKVRVYRDKGKGPLLGTFTTLAAAYAALGGPA